MVHLENLRSIIRQLPTEMFSFVFPVFVVFLISELKSNLAQIVSSDILHNRIKLQNIQLLFVCFLFVFLTRRKDFILIKWILLRSRSQSFGECLAITRFSSKSRFYNGPPFKGF